MRSVANEYLSGEVEDWKTLQVVGSNCNLTTSNEVDSSFSTILPNIPSSKPPLIQFIHANDDDNDDDDSRSSSDNDEPPPLQGKMIVSFQQNLQQPSGGGGGGGAGAMTTLMEEMIADSGLAPQKTAKPTPTTSYTPKLKKSTVSSNSSGGMKKGFLLSSNKSKKAEAGAAAPNQPTSPPSYTTSTTDGSKTIADYHVVAAKSSTRSTKSCVEMVFPDTPHDSLRPSCALPNSTMTTTSTMNNVLEQIQEKPRLMKALQDPSFIRALQIIQEHPNHAKSIFQQDASMAALLQEFCQCMGVGTSTTKSGITTTTSTPPAAPPDAVCSEQDQVDRLLAEQPMIRQALIDPDMQCIMQECQTHPGRFQTYMTHPKYGPWLQLLIQHGLLQVQR